MSFIIFFDPLFTGGAALVEAFDWALGDEHARSLPPEPVSRGRQVERGALDIWFNGRSALTLNFHARRDALPYSEPFVTCAMIDHPIDRLYAQYVHFINLYLRFPEYADGSRSLPTALASFPSFAAAPGHDNQLVRFFAEMENHDVVTSAHLRGAIHAVDAIDHVWTSANVAEGIGLLGPPLDASKATLGLAAGQAKIAAWRRELARILAARPRDMERPASGAASSAVPVAPPPRLPFPDETLAWLMTINQYDMALFQHVMSTGDAPCPAAP